MIRRAAIFALIVSFILIIVSCAEDTTGLKDTGPSNVSIITPWDDTTREGIIDVLVSAEDEDDIARVDLYVVGSLYGSDAKDPYEFKWNMSEIEDGSPTSIYAVAVDGYGNKTNSKVVTVTKGHNAVPELTLTSPTDGITIFQDDTIILSGTATDSEDGELGAGNITWSSNLQGTLEPNEDNESTGLVIGEHIITMTAADYDDVKGTTSVTVTVEENESNNYAYIPKGTYYIGEPAFKKETVTITRSFWISKTEMTVKELAQAMELIHGDKVVKDFITKRNKELWGKTGDGLYPKIYGADPELDGENPDFDNLIYKDYPAIFITYVEAIGICNALSLNDGYTTAYDVQKKSITFIKGANGWRLPTEAEWEIAARGGLSGKKFPWGDGSPRGMCNSMTEQSLPDPIPIFNGRGPVPVKSYQPNAFGLYNIAGNVAEMCSDIFVGTVPSGVDPVGLSQEKMPRYTVKGGTWYGYEYEMQICLHVLTLPYNRMNADKYNTGIGIRLVRNVE